MLCHDLAAISCRKRSSDEHYRSISRLNLEAYCSAEWFGKGAGRVSDSRSLTNRTGKIPPGSR